MPLLAAFRRGCTTIIIALVFVVLGSVLTVVLGQTITLACTRQEPIHIICERESTFMGFRLGKPQTIEGLEGAWVEESCDEDCTYRVMLQADRGNVPLTSSYSSGASPKDEMAGRINAYVNGTQTEARITSNPEWFAMVAAASFAVIGLLLLPFGLLHR